MIADKMKNTRRYPGAVLLFYWLRHQVGMRSAVARRITRATYKVAP